MPAICAPGSCGARARAPSPAPPPILDGQPPCPEFAGARAYATLTGRLAAIIQGYASLCPPFDARHRGACRGQSRGQREALPCSSRLEIVLVQH